MQYMGLSIFIFSIYLVMIMKYADLILLPSSNRKYECMPLKTHVIQG